MAYVLYIYEGPYSWDPQYYENELDAIMEGWKIQHHRENITFDVYHS